MLVSFLAFVVIIVLFLVLLIFRKKQVSSHVKKPAKKTIHRIKGKADEALSRQLRKTDTELKVLLELYPSLKEIAYFRIPDGIFPTPAQNIDENIQEAIKQKVSAIKPIPANYVKLLDLLRNPDSNPGEITTMVSTNPIFSAKILQTVNSAYFGLGQKVTSLGRGITLLGYNNVRSLLFQDSLISTLPKQLKEAEVYVDIWIHSAIVSACAGYLGKEIFRFSEYDLATIGLLHDIGKCFIRSLEVRAEPVTGLPGIIQEEQEYGINHAALGSLIGNNWQLSDSVIRTIEYHHYPNFFPPEAIPEPYLKQSFVVCISDLIVKVLGYRGREEEILPIKEEYFKLFRLSPELPELITRVLTKEIEKTRLVVESYVKTALSP